MENSEKKKLLGNNRNPVGDVIYGKKME